MLDKCENNGTTHAGNFKHPTVTDCNSWVVETWKEFRINDERKKVVELRITSDTGQDIIGLQDTVFQDVQPNNTEENFGDSEISKEGGNRGTVTQKCPPRGRGGETP